MKINRLLRRGKKVLNIFLVLLVVLPINLMIALPAAACERAISGYKFIDTDRDGEWDSGELGKEGWEIFLRDASGARITVFTDSHGYYKFDNLIDGTYEVKEVITDGYAQSFPAIGYHEVTISSGNEITDKNFGNYSIDCGNGIYEPENEEECDGTDNVGEHQVCSNLCMLIDLTYCGDEEVNQDWEECDGQDGLSGSGYTACTEKCQFEGDNSCSDLVLARVNVDEVKNWPNGDMTSDIYLGSVINKIPAGAWFALYHNGSYVIPDNDITGYENVPGLAVQRLDGSVRAVIHGSNASGIIEHIHGNIEFYNAAVINQRDDNSGNNKLEKGFDGNGVGNYNAGDDEVWMTGGDDSHSNFWLTVTVADDGYYADWKIIEDCQTVNQPPVAIAAATPTTTVVGAVINFDGSGSYDIDGIIISYDWDFGDIATSSGVATTHIYTATGTYDVVLTVIDNDNATGTDTIQIIIEDGGVPSQCVDVDGDGYDNCAIGEYGDDGNQIDCDDNNPNANPGMQEDCATDYDDNCDGNINEGCGNGDINYGDIIINELMWMGSEKIGDTGSQNDEWIELKNASSSPINLIDCYLTKFVNATTTEKMLDIPDIQIAIGGFYLISNYAADNIKSNLDATPDLVNTAVSLSNTKLQIKLYCSDTLIDTAGDGNAPLAGDNGDPKYSMSRNDIPGYGTSTADWHNASARYGWDENTTEWGTPGADNNYNGYIGIISGYKFNDEDNNGIDDGEPKLGGWVIELYDNASSTNPIATTTTSFATTTLGIYFFENLALGDYWVKEVQQNNWTQTNSASTTATITISSTTPTVEVNFGNYYEEPNYETGIISGYKFGDENENGEWDDNEIGINDWIIELYDDANATTSIATATTSATIATLGYYEFTNLEAGVYVIREKQENPDWIQTYPTSTEYHEIDLSAGETSEDNNFGNYYNVIPLVCIDMDGDGYFNEISDIECGEKDCDDDNENIHPGASEICGDGIDNNCDGNIDENCGGGGGGGGSTAYLYIHSEKTSDPVAQQEFITETITWHTNKLATSRVVYGTSSVQMLGEWPNLGYQYSTDEYLDKVTFHQVSISGLLPNTTYYFRPISSASPEIFGEELVITTPQLKDIQKPEEPAEEEEENGGNKDEEAEEDEKQEEPAANQGSESGYSGYQGVIGEGAQTDDVVVLGERLVLADDLLPQDDETDDIKEEIKEEAKEDNGKVEGENIRATSSADSADEDCNCWNEWWWLIILLLLIIAYFAYENYRIKDENKEDAGGDKTE